MNKFDLYKCDVCGNIIQVMINGGGELVCCGKPMQKLQAQNYEEAIMEKHVPIFIDNNNGTSTVRVGEILHPMQPEHYIRFIQTISEDKNCSQIKFLEPGDEPKLIVQNKHLYAREYCNIHGLWEGKNA